MNELKPGRELDALVAEKVMGWRRADLPMADGLLPRKIMYWIDPNQCEFGPQGHPNYSIDIAAAWEVVEKLKPSNFEVLFFRENNRFDARFNWAKEIGVGESVPHAICLAALKAVGAIE